MLTRGDDFPIHQTAEPILYSGTDRNFYDRYFFNGYDREGQTFFAAALGVYPHLNVMDAALSVVSDGVQCNLRASRVMHFERLNTSVGPLEIEVVEPLEKLRIRADRTEDGLRADILFTGRHFPVEEPRFTRRNGSRTFLDLTRMTQNGTYEGWIEVKGRRIELSPDRFWGTRDRSWGVRNVGSTDPQPIVPEQPPQFYWLWSPLNFEDRCLYFHVNEDGSGHRWNTRASIAEVGTDAPEEMTSCSAELSFQPGTRHARTAHLSLVDRAGGKYEVRLQPLWHFYMRGIGYFDPEWSHGTYKGELAVAYDELVQSDADDAQFDHLHIQAVCTARLTGPDGTIRQGNGVLEQLILGPHEPSGFSDSFDPAGG